MLTLTFNAPPESDADEIVAAHFYVPKGQLDALVADERAFRVLCSGQCFRVTFECADEGAYLAELVKALLEQHEARALH
jgi:hypothetical protein